MPENDYDSTQETQEERDRRKRRAEDQIEEARKSEADNPFAQRIDKSRASQFVDSFTGKKSK